VPQEIPTIKKVIPLKGEDIPFRQLKILIAEDDITSDLLLTRIVKKFCKEPLHVSSGVEAIETCRNNRDIDLILMDIQMLDMNGYEATKQIRKFNKDVLIFAQTAYSMNGDKEKSIAAGCNDYITKPIDKDVLIDLIKTYFN
jgi:CheY-like chemotaxis protein